MSEAIRLVQEQANDEALWFASAHSAEACLREALRELHAAVERDALAAPPETPQAVDAARRKVIFSAGSVVRGANWTGYFESLVAAFEAAVRADECRRVYEAAYDADLPERPELP